MQALLMLWGAATVVFLIIHVIPGDAVAYILSSAPTSPEVVARVRAEIGLDERLDVRYLRFLADAVRGDFGTSFTTGRPVWSMIVEQLPATVTLAATAMALAVGLGLVLGISSAARRGSWIDRTAMSLAALGISVPAFWMGLLLLSLFSLTLGWLPATGTAGIERLIMPATALSFGSAAAIARFVRASLLEELGRDYVRTAIAKGLPPRAALLRHALPNALAPTITIIGLHFGYLLAGAAVTETIFARQGLGRLAIQGVLGKDLPLVEGVVLVSTVVYLVVNLAVDVSYRLIDPRVGIRQE